MSKEQNSNSSGIVASTVLVCLVLYGVWIQRGTIWERIITTIEPYIPIIIVLLILVIGIPVFIWITMKVSQIVYYFRRYPQMRTVEVILSRDDTTEPFEVMKFFDAVNGMLLTRFPWVGWFQGFPHLVWEQGVESGRKYTWLSAPGPILESICGSLQSVYQNIRFEEVQRKKDQPIPEEYLQLRLQRHWLYPIQTLKTYQKTISESFFSALDKSEGDVRLQIVMTPLSLRQQGKLGRKQEKFEAKHTSKGITNPENSGMGMTKQKELKASIESRGKGLFQCEIRLFADSEESRQSVIGSLAEASAENRLVPEYYVNWLLRRMLIKVWWRWWAEEAMPAIGLGPTVRLSSFHLSTLMQLPTMRLRVSGLERSSTRRVPVPSGVPRDESQAFMVDEEGRPVSIEKGMRYLNTFFVGMQGSGKTQALTHYAGPVLSDMNRAAFIVTPDRGDAEKYLSYIPPEKPVYILDLSRPGEHGLNILSDDSVPADQLAGNLLSAFRTAYGRDAVGDQSADFLQQPLYALRKVREVSPDWRSVIPILDFRHLRRMLVDDDFRAQVTASLPEESSSFDYWGRQIPKLMETKNFYNQRIAPILNKFNALLTSERVEAILCHPNPITLRQVIDERGVVLLYNAKNEVGEETANLFSNMLMSMVFQAVSSQVNIPEDERVEVDLILDEIQGYANQAVKTMLQESRKYGARTAAATLSFSDLPADIKTTFKNLFGHKVIFRINEVAEAEELAKSFAQLHSNMITVQDEVQDRIRIGADDIMQLGRFEAIARFTVQGNLLPAFKVKTRPIDPNAKEEWKRSHPWPEGKNIRPNPIDLSKLIQSQTKETIEEKESVQNKLKPQEPPTKEFNNHPLPSLSWPIVGDIPKHELQAICDAEGYTLEKALPILEETDKIIQRMKKSNQGIRSQPKLLRSQLKKARQKEKNESKEGSWIEVGGLDPEKVKKLVEEEGMTLEQARPLLEKAQKEYLALKKQGKKRINRPNIIRQVIKEYQAEEGEAS